MIELIFLIILICSLVGMGLMLFQKMPLLLELPETSPPYFGWRTLFLKVKSSNPLKGFPSEVFLQKILSKVRILTLKTDNKTSNWLQKLRERSQKKKFSENDNYWKEIKKSTKR